MLEYISYKSVNGLEFGASVEDAINTFGEPESKSRSRFSNLEFYYSLNGSARYSFLIIFDENDKFSEFLLYPYTKATINGLEIGWELNDMMPIINSSNDARMDDDGITLYDLGISFSAFDIPNEYQNRSINFFNKGLFDKFRNDTKPFDIDAYRDVL